MTSYGRPRQSHRPPNRTQNKATYRALATRANCIFINDPAGAELEGPPTKRSLS